MSARARVQHAVRSVVVAVVLIATAAPIPGQAQARGGGGGRERPLTLESARRARFTATEGTWMSLDVSPDGSTIVFDLLGDLYLMPAAGRKAARLTSGMAFDAQPRFSPDGTRVAFVSDRSGGENVWIAHVDLTDTIQVTRGDNSVWVSPEWTPDGKHVVVSRSSGVRDPADLVMVDVELRTPLPLVTTPNSRKSLGAALSPDGRWIWYAARSGDWEYNTRFPNYQLYRYDRETGQSSVMSNRYGSAFRPAVSPRRQLAGLRDPGGCRDRSPQARLAHRRGELAGPPCAARRSGVACPARRPPGLRVHPGLRRRHRLVRRRHLACAAGWRGRELDPVFGGRRRRDRSRGQVRLRG